MTKKELIAKMKAYLDTQDSTTMDEWYITNRELNEFALQGLAEYLNLGVRFTEED